MNIPDEIDAAMEAKPPEKPRQYIGASIIGSDCIAYLALSLRGFPNDQPPPRVRRVFRLGHLIENEVIEALRDAGYHVWDRDPLTGRQFEYQDFGGHIAFHMDGKIEGRDEKVRILEIKSMNSERFNSFRTSGLRRSHPAYYAQVQFEMGYTGYDEAVLVAYCKNDSSYHAEVIEFDLIYFEALRAKAEAALSPGAKRIADQPDDWRCRFCFKKTACWGSPELTPSCANCANSLPSPDGRWHCVLHEREAVALCPKWQRWRPDDKG